MSKPSRRWVHRATSAALAVAIGFATLSCGSEDSSSGGTASPTPQSPDAAKIEEIVREKMTALDLTSAVFGAWRGDEQIAVGALGGSPIGVSATPDMQLRVGQPMEPMLSTVLLQLDKDGVVPLDKPIAEWVPDFPRADKITPRMLANGTTGISDYVTNPEFLKQFYANPMAGFTAQQIFDLANSRPPLFEPGTSWAYAHSDLCLLGVVLEKATGQPLGDLIEQRILDPLDMNSTDVVLTPQMTQPTLHGYTNERGVFEDSTFWNPTAFLNSGNMNSTLSDVAVWVRALAAGKLLSAEQFTEMMAPKTAGLGPLTPQKYFAYGVVHIDDWLYMNPAFGGYNGVAFYDTKTDTTIVVYCTLGPKANADTNNAVPIGTDIGTLLVPDRPPKV
ncbi:MULTISPECIES: serine hydrolase [unclassified Rhodococcus (in: high G+C Gram-positive bacteria)]|uniref:serine hydrolase domain-containing protein n=1 Tax=unclassified Rhodococcus (in: high G+C Gram-positive bacteria) TaxID=192944 RepID=UPI00163970B8|nr:MULTISPECIES: serine hydrolase domain-containing protein [unclassified Rhodococcus (in: high G+C Gram-positive bacteria)]MBC2644160.1 beta-lactamase family protein [Rhodococcus sp. 3A]MBC2891101.1 beta-lactamase family protein [Rhodococcus sp. 4CII]